MLTLPRFMQTLSKRAGNLTCCPTPNLNFTWCNFDKKYVKNKLHNHNGRLV